METASDSTKSSSNLSHAYKTPDTVHSTPPTSVETGFSDAIASSSGTSVSQGLSESETLSSIKVSLSGIVPNHEPKDTNSWNRDKAISVSRRLESLDTLLEARKRGQDSKKHELKPRNNLQSTLDATSVKLQKICSASRFEKFLNENSNKAVLSDHFEELSDDLSAYGLSLLQQLFVISMEIMEIAKIKTIDEREKELKRRMALQRALERLVLIPEDASAAALVERILNQEHAEALEYCVWSMRSSVRAYQVALQQHLLKICPNIIAIELEQDFDNKQILKNLQMKLSIISAHYQLILDQHPARMFIENPKSYLDLLYSVEYMCSAMTEHQISLDRLLPRKTMEIKVPVDQSVSDQVISSDSSVPSQTLSSSTRWDVDFIKVHLSSSKGREILRTADENNALLVVDLIDEILDSSATTNLTRRASYFKTMQSICGRCAILPTSHMISEGLEITSKKPVASGGFADVFQGRFNNAVVAVKVFKRSKLNHLDRLQRMFYKEAVLWRRLSHENVLPFLGAASLALHQLALVSAWMQKGDIVGYIKTNRQVNRLDLLVDVSAGVEYLHSINLAHGDLKGKNILISGEDRALLADFGLMTVVYDSGVTHVMTTTTSSKGTVRWMSPELVNPDTFGGQNGNPTKASDVYALAMVILEVLTGKIPFHKLQVNPVISKVMRGHYPIRPQNSMDIGFSDRIWELVRLCWSTDALERPDVKYVKEVIKAESKCWDAASDHASDEEKHDSDDSSFSVDNFLPSPEPSSIYPYT